MRKKVSRVAISMCAAASMVLSVVAPAMTVAAETTDEPVEFLEALKGELDPNTITNDDIKKAFITEWNQTYAPLIFPVKL